MAGLDATHGDLVGFAVVNRIRELREARGFTQADLAYMLGVRAATVSEWETRGRKPTRAIRNKLARKLGVKVEELGLEDEK